MSEATDIIRRRVAAIRSVHSDAALTEAANEHHRRAERYAAELLDSHGTPSIYDEALELIAIAYLAGAVDERKWARDNG